MVWSSRNRDSNAAPNINNDTAAKNNIQSHCFRPEPEAAIAPPSYAPHTMGSLIEPARSSSTGSLVLGAPSEHSHLALPVCLYVCLPCSERLSAQIASEARANCSLLFIRLRRRRLRGLLGGRSSSGADERRDERLRGAVSAESASSRLADRARLRLRFRPARAKLIDDAASRPLVPACALLHGPLDAGAAGAHGSALLARALPRSPLQIRAHPIRPTQLHFRRAETAPAPDPKRAEPSRIASLHNLYCVSRPAIDSPTLSLSARASVPLYRPEPLFARIPGPCSCPRLVCLATHLRRPRTPLSLAR